MDLYNKYYKCKKKNKNNYITKILLSIIFFLVCIIYTKIDVTNKKNFEKIFLNDSISFVKVNNFYQKYFGNIIPMPDVTKESLVFSEQSNIKTKEKYLNGEMLSLDNSNVNALESGIVVFIGEKEGYNNTIIVQGNDGVDIWYGNILNTNLNLYDYVKKNDIMAQVNDNILYLVFMKDNDFIKYEEYNSN